MGREFALCHAQQFPKERHAAAPDPDLGRNFHSVCFALQAVWTNTVIELRVVMSGSVVFKLNPRLRIRLDFLTVRTGQLDTTGLDSIRFLCFAGGECSPDELHLMGKSLPRFRKLTFQ